MIPETIGGLPLHPLVVHGSVVLVPLAALALLIIPWRANWRRSYGIPVALLAIAGWGFSLLATQSGEHLEEAAEDAGRHLGEHPEMGDFAMWTAAALMIVAIGLVVLDRLGDRLKERRIEIASGVACAIIALGSLGAMIRAGHSGAEVVWSDTKVSGEGADNAEGNEGNESAEEADESFVPARLRHHHVVPLAGVTG